jgi:hypothetical protein
LSDEKSTAVSVNRMGIKREEKGDDRKMRHGMTGKQNAFIFFFVQLVLKITGTNNGRFS